jgi:hypothetical protein
VNLAPFCQNGKAATDAKVELKDTLKEKVFANFGASDFKICILYETTFISAKKIRRCFAVIHIGKKIPNFTPISKQSAKVATSPEFKVKININCLE